MTDPVTPDLSTRHPTVSFADALDELRREIAARRRTYPDWITRGRMTQAEADHQLALFEAIAADVERYARFVSTRQLAPPAHKFSWHQRREALRREADLRARIFPEWIAKGRLEQGEADRRTSILAAITDLFDDGFDWQPRNGHARIGFGTDPVTPAEREALAEWHDHYTTVMQARGLMAPAQEALAL